MTSLISVVFDDVYGGMLRRRAARTGASRDLWRWRRGFETQSQSHPELSLQRQSAVAHPAVRACKSASSASNRRRVLHEGVVIVTIINITSDGGLA